MKLFPFMSLLCFAMIVHLCSCSLLRREETYELVFSRPYQVGYVYRSQHQCQVSAVIYSSDPDGQDEEVMQQDLRILYDYQIVSRGASVDNDVGELVILEVESRGDDPMNAQSLEGAIIVIETEYGLVRYLKNGNADLTEEELQVLHLLYSGPLPASDDRIYSPEKPVSVGYRWGINREAYAQHFNSAGVILSRIEAANIKGWVRLASVEKERALVQSSVVVRENNLETQGLIREVETSIEEEIDLPLNPSHVSRRRAANIVTVTRLGANDGGIERLVVTMHLSTELVEIRQ